MNGKIGGYSGGTGWKEKLLAREALSVKTNHPESGSLHIPGVTQTN
jgi:hypothetical protein